MNMPVSLHDLSSSDKDKLLSITRSQMIKAAVMYLPVFLLVGGAVIWVNNRPLSLGLQDENVRSVISLVGVVLSLLALRLFANYVIAHTKASKSWQKKIVRGEITGMKGRKVYCAGQEFEVPSSQAATLKPGDEIIAEITVSGNHLLSLQKTSTQATTAPPDQPAESAAEEAK
ncbi:MAG: hypothetical protein MUC87_19980 [Bacteroidia bacterium]|jgi:hypothetical protein|nr:hypothetical protein [Bacteroidia bacterium]